MDLLKWEGIIKHKTVEYGFPYKYGRMFSRSRMRNESRGKKGRRVRFSIKYFWRFLCFGHSISVIPDGITGIIINVERGLEDMENRTN